MTYALLFFLLAILLTAEAVLVQGPAWLLLWPAFSFLLVAAGYARLGPGVFGKRRTGGLRLWAVLAVLPYLLLTWGLWHFVRFFSREDCWNKIAPGLYLGRRAFPRELPSGVTFIVDLTGEFPAPRGIQKGREYLCLPILDATSPGEAELRALIEQVAAWEGEVYIHCAQGHGRSALVMAGVLLRRGLACDVAEAIQRLKAARPGVRIKKPQRELLDRLGLVPDRDRNE